MADSWLYKLPKFDASSVDCRLDRIEKVFSKLEAVAEKAAAGRDASGPEAVRHIFLVTRVCLLISKSSARIFRAGSLIPIQCSDYFRLQPQDLEPFRETTANSPDMVSRSALSLLLETAVLAIWQQSLQAAA